MLGGPLEKIWGNGRLFLEGRRFAHRCIYNGLMNSATHSDVFASVCKSCLALALGLFALCGCASCAQGPQQAASSDGSSEASGAVDEKRFDGVVSDKIMTEGVAPGGAVSGASADSASGSAAGDKNLVVNDIAAPNADSPSAAGGSTSSGGSSTGAAASGEASGKASGKSTSGKASSVSSNSSAADAASGKTAFSGNAIGAASANSAGSSAGSSAGASSAKSASDGAVPDEELLASLVGEDYAAKLLQGAKDDADRYWIAAHPEALDLGDAEMQVKLLRLAADEDAAVKYVRDYPQRYVFDPDENADGFGPAKAKASDEAVKASSYPKVKTGNANVPHLYQWDQRWGYSVYSSSAFGLAGCGPTALAIAYQGVTGKSDINPFEMGELAYGLGYMTQSEGTNNALFTAAASQLGMDCAIIDISEGSIRDAIENNCVVVANMGNGTFSNYGGHFVVLTGFDGEGKVVMNDPYSVENSQRTWDVDFLLGETKALFAFAKEGQGLVTPTSAAEYAEPEYAEAEFETEYESEPEYEFDPDAEGE